LELSVAGFAAQRVPLTFKAFEQVINIRVANWAIITIKDKVLLADIGCVIAVSIFGE
jgi:hypothetical protein